MMAVCELGSSSSPDTEFAGTLTLDFPASRCKFLLSISHTVYGIFVLAARTKTVVIKFFGVEWFYDFLKQRILRF